MQGPSGELTITSAGWVTFFVRDGENGRPVWVPSRIATS